MKEKKRSGVMAAGIIGGILVALILILGTYWMGRSAERATEEAVRSVSLFYLGELAERREQVVAKALDTYIKDINVAIGLMDETDLIDVEHLQAYQAQIKQLYHLEKFAFVDRNGLIYTSLGTQDDIESYPFDYSTLSEAEVLIKDLESSDKTVIIAEPVQNMRLGDQELVVCFMEISMDQMLEGISLSSNENETTFCNIYTTSGVALTDMVLGGTASERNLLEAMEHAVFEPGSSMESFLDVFSNGREGSVSFTYNGIQETLYYAPIEGTDWMLTYLIRETVISNQISSVTQVLVTRSLIQTVVSALIILAVFIVILRQLRKSAKLTLEKETADAANRAKQEELEERIALQEELLEQEKQRTQQDNMINAMASDYRSVYYVDLDNDQGICYRTDLRDSNALKEGESFSYHETFAKYAEKYVAEGYREGFLEFIRPENIRAALEKENLIVYRYLISRNGIESYEMLRMADVHHAEQTEDRTVHAVGVGFTNVDRETREDLAKNQALSDALHAAEEANKAKTAFLSNMSHEIRTPMNAIIGLGNIALNDREISAKTRKHLERIDDSAKHLLSLINDILDMSRIESGRLSLKHEEFSLQKLLEQVNTIISGQCQDKGLSYNCHIEGEIDDYYIGDDMKLRQILINILGNAVKFTAEGGNVALNVKRLRQYDKKSTIQFEMTDTGIGISKDYLPKIFDAFSQEDSSTTNQYGSSGLGLAITKNFVDMMNGRIEVESEKGVGSKFTVTVTLQDSDRVARPEEKNIRLQEMNVLVVDDEPVALEHAKLILEKVGIEAETASSGEEAVEMTRVRHARRKPYDLILVDWKMPELDGVETARRIRSIIGEESAIIILTAYRWDDVLEEAMDAGVDSFIAKPLFAGNVIEEFKRTIEKKGLGKSEEPSGKSNLNGKRVLLAEDMEVNSQILIMVLQMKGVETELAVNGKIAVEMFASHPPGYYDAILMDVRMPEMDGLTATVKIREMDREDAKTIPMIALTANAFDEDVQRSLQAGLNAHLSKPVDPPVLFETLESLIRD